MIERTYRGVDPQPTITAPLPLPRDGHSESVRLATFRQSFATRNGVVAPFPLPATASASPGRRR